MSFYEKDNTFEHVTSANLGRALVGPSIPLSNLDLLDSFLTRKVLKTKWQMDSLVTFGKRKRNFQYFQEKKLTTQKLL